MGCVPVKQSSSCAQNTRLMHSEFVAHLVMKDTVVGEYRRMLGESLKVELLDRLSKQADGIAESYAAVDNQTPDQIFLTHVTFLVKDHEFSTDEDDENLSSRPVVDIENVQSAIEMLSDEATFALYIKSNARAMSQMRHKTTTLE